MRKPKNKKQEFMELMNEIEAEGLSDAIQHVRDLVTLGEAYGLAIWKSAEQFDVDKSLLASFIGRLGRFRKQS